MPKVSIYLNQRLYDRAREAGLNLSHLTQAAIGQALGDGISTLSMLEQIKSMCDLLITETCNRTQIIYDSMVAAGLDPALLLADQPLLRDYPAYVHTSDEVPTG